MTKDKYRIILDAKFVISFIVAWTLLLLSLSKTINGNNLIYAIGEIRTYDARLFNENVYMGEGVISPRYIVDMVFNVIMHINGGNWAGAALIWIYFGAILQAFGVANISHRMNKKNSVIVSAILVCLFMYCGSYLAEYSLIELTTTSIGPALGFSFLSISFLVGEKRNYNLAWIFAASAVICSIHEGMYCCVVIFLFAFVDSIIAKRILLKENWTIIIAIVALGMVVVPSILTDTMNISNSAFVYIYSVFRHPHHLVSSSWDQDFICKTIWINIGLFLLCLQTKMNEKKMDDIRFYMYESVALVVVWILAITIMYVFTEIKPVAFISTMYLSKLFKYVLLIALIWSVQSAFELRERGNYLSSYLLIFFAFLASSYELAGSFILGLIIYVVMKVEDYFVSAKYPFVSDKIVPVIDVCFFVVILCIKRERLGLEIGNILALMLAFKSTMASALESGMNPGIVIILVVFAIMIIEFAIKKQFRGYKVLCVLICVCMVLLSLMGRVIIYENGSIGLINGEKALIASMGNELYDFACEFRDSTDTTVSFLSDPNDETNSGCFQVVSERNCYVVYKVIPSSKSTVNEWYERYQQVSGFDEKTSDELKQIMDSAGILYCLVDTDNYGKLDESTDFSVFMNSSNDSFRVYVLN